MQKYFPGNKSTHKTTELFAICFITTFHVKCLKIEFLHKKCLLFGNFYIFFATFAKKANISQCKNLS